MKHQQFFKHVLKFKKVLLYRSNKSFYRPYKNYSMNCITMHTETYRHTISLESKYLKITNFKIVIKNCL